jgi:hypothetical protein
MCPIHAFSVNGTRKLLIGVPIRRPLFQGARWRVGIEFSVVVAISDAHPFHLSARSASTRPAAMACPERARCADSSHSWLIDQPSRFDRNRSFAVPTPQKEFAPIADDPRPPDNAVEA